MNNINEEQHAFPRWWLKPLGELFPCGDHEFEARQYLRSIDPEYLYGGIRDTYDRVFSAGWVRVIAEPDQIMFDGSREPNAGQWRSLRDLSAERGVPLYNTRTMRIVKGAPYEI